ncbi:MAG: hypothetical protein U9Q83_05950, partial [Bacteroidota bacterium]|nr:hypothetical protein [Bacteroidota bacterium]
MQEKYRFIGIRPFEEKEKDLFFERDMCAEKIYKSIYFNKITVVHSIAGTGKTSVIKAGLLPKVNSNKKFNTLYFSIPNYIKSTNISPIKIIGEKIDKFIGEYSYLDKIIKPEDSLWYKLKRLSGTNDKEILIIIDQFENIFSFSETEIVKFKDEIVKALFEQIPQNIRDEVNSKLKENPKLLTPKGLEKLYKTINIKILFVSRSDKLFKLNFFKDKINAIDKNLIEIEQISKQQAKNILIKTANFKTKYNIDNDFISDAFKMSEELIDEILNFLTKNNAHNIETYQLQIIGREIEILSINKSLDIVNVSEISDFKGLYNDYYEAVINEISDSIQKVAARKFIEGELIFEYEHRKLTILDNVAKTKYNLSDETINALIQSNLILTIKNENGDVFYEISHDALITPILIAKEKRIKYEIQIEKELLQKKIIEEKAKAEEKRAIKNKKISYIFLSLFLLVLILGAIALKQRNIAVRNQKLANSSLFASIAFKYLNTDPTLSF